MKERQAKEGKVYIQTDRIESYPLTPLPDEVGGGVITEGPSLLLATWTPKGHGLITVKDYDIYYRPAPRSSTGYRVTDTGVPGTIHNGVPDWLYEGLNRHEMKIRITDMIQQLDYQMTENLLAHVE
ncbi:unnamed protein product [Arctia plantaginis]|uniref:Dipeptidylpeptidase IV N-terminal domain-containing protein n=1 Tax=Arctia plantaginis TaxID=874455 RepID=A0A8S1B6H6_ARCPL|nr:unnamed protein product [Arctia plantaginis]